MNTDPTYGTIPESIHTRQIVDLRKSNTQEFNYEEVKEHIIVGEGHIRTINSPSEDERFNKLLESSINRNTLVVLETDAKPEQDLWSDYRLEYNLHGKNFMTTTLEYCMIHNIYPQIINDLESPVYPTDFLENTDPSFTQYDHCFMEGLFEEKYRNYEETSFDEMLTLIETSTKLSRIQKKGLSDGTIVYRASLIFNRREPRNISQLISLFTNYNITCKERLYQSRISNLTEKKPNKKIFAVFGDNHRKGIGKTLENPEYKTPLQYNPKMKTLLASIKKMAKNEFL